jgi:hypothetical protein
MARNQQKIIICYKKTEATRIVASAYRFYDVPNFNFYLS